MKYILNANKDVILQDVFNVKLLLIWPPFFTYAFQLIKRCPYHETMITLLKMTLEFEILSKTLLCFETLACFVQKEYIRTCLGCGEYKRGHNRCN